MKIAIMLDGVLCDPEELKDEWFRRLGDWKFLNDAVFWAALQPYDDVAGAIKALSQHDLYVFAERPKAVFLPTRAWLRNNAGLVLDKTRLILPSLFRYDCRINGIDALITARPDDIENLKTETVHPVVPYLIDRSQGRSLCEIAGEINEGICGRD